MLPLYLKLWKEYLDHKNQNAIFISQPTQSPASISRLKEAGET